MLTSEQIQLEIQNRFGFIPPFFSPAQHNPQVLSYLWHQTLSAYIENPLPSLFKEKLSAYLSRYCAIPYCMICHSCTLKPLGMQAQEILTLLESPPPFEMNLEEHLNVLRCETGKITLCLEIDSVLEASLLACSTSIFLQPEVSESCRKELLRLLGTSDYQHLFALIAYVRTCHMWVEAHPEIAYEADKRVQEHLGLLLQEEPRLAEFFANYKARVQQEIQRQRQHQAELPKHQHNDVINQRITSIFESIADIFLSLDHQWQFTYLNVHAERFFQSSRAALLGRNIWELSHSSMLRPYQQQCHQALIQQVSTTFEVFCDSLNIWFEARVYPTQFGLSIYLQDITLRKQKEDKLQAYLAQIEQALKFDSLLKRITDKVRDSLDERQILQTVVQALALGLEVDGCDTALYDLEQGTSTVCYEYSPSFPSNQGHVLLIGEHFELHTQLLQGQSLQFCLLSSSPIWLGQDRSILGCPISDEQGVLGDLWLYAHPSYIFSDPEIRLVQQISNQCAIAIRQARLYQAAQVQVENLEKLNHLKDDFLSTVSHELRAPMANIKMAIHMMKIALTSEQRERYLTILETECTRETELINNLLDLQQLEADMLPISLEALHLQDWLPSVIESFQVRACEHQQNLTLTWADNLPLIFSDPPSLSRILVELLNNACKYTPAEGRITLSVVSAPHSFEDPSSPSEIVFVVGNQSEIPATELPYIFNKFYRVPQADPWQQRGTGLGLALVQKLVEKLAGSIEVTSDNGWTEFILRFPISQS